MSRSISGYGRLTPVEIQRMADAALDMVLFPAAGGEEYIAEVTPERFIRMAAELRMLRKRVELVTRIREEGSALVDPPEVESRADSLEVLLVAILRLKPAQAAREILDRGFTRPAQGEGLRRPRGYAP